MERGQGVGAINHWRADDGGDSGRVRQCGDEQVGSSLSRPGPLSANCSEFVISERFSTATADQSILVVSCSGMRVGGGVNACALGWELAL